MINISTSSHTSSKEINRDAFSELNDLLLSKENPYFNYFNEEMLLLDDTDGFVSIVTSSYIYDDEITEELAKWINDFVRSNLFPSSRDIFIYVGSYIFKK